MSDINFIIAKKEDLKSLIYQWLDEHPHFLFDPHDKEKADKPMSRAEIAEYLGISTVTVTDWMKKGLPYKRMNGRVYFIKEDVMAAMPTFNHRKNAFLSFNTTN